MFKQSMYYLLIALSITATPWCTAMESDPQCVICLDDPVNNRDNIIALDPCGHRFHMYCIHQWLVGDEHELYAANCPICRVVPHNNFADYRISRRLAQQHQRNAARDLRYAREDARARGEQRITHAGATLSKQLHHVSRIALAMRKIIIVTALCYVGYKLFIQSKHKPKDIDQIDNEAYWFSSQETAHA